MRIKQLASPATDYETTMDDKVLGNELAHYMGDTFIDSTVDAPVDQWTEIVKFLRVHGLKITEDTQ